jgi:putative NADH-flavin reductase
VKRIILLRTQAHKEFAMKIAVVAATGKIGRHIVQQALQKGHEVTAIVRSDKNLPVELKGAAVSVATFEKDSLVNALRGHDAIISAYGPTPEATAALSDAAHKLIAAVREAGLRRLVVVGGAGSLEVAPGLQLVDTPEFPAAYKAVALAHRDALAVYRAASNLDWTFFSPAAEIGPGEIRGRYRTGENNLLVDGEGRSRISYGDYAAAVVAEVEQPRYVQTVATAAY